MFVNPQTLVDHEISFRKAHEYPTEICVDAVFIPFKHRWWYINDLLTEIRWFKGPIYLIPSDPVDISSVVWDKNQEVHVLYPLDHQFARFLADLRTSKRLRDSCYYSLIWDLPLKRNHALLHARKKGYEKVLLVDDDIRGLTPEVVTSGCDCLEQYVLSGCFVEEFPDTSAIGHLELMCGEDLRVFLSGSFLFVKVAEARGFFPHVYNEDWLFMLDHVTTRSICSFGSIKQLGYDPFKDPHRVAFQEFGEIIAEGLYALVNADQYESRYEHQTWNCIIEKRRADLVSLKHDLRYTEYEGIVDVALNVNCGITPNDCLTFLDDWDNDVALWSSFLEEV